MIISKKLFIPVKLVDNKLKYTYDTHTNMKVYKSIQTLKKYLKEDEYDFVLVYSFNINQILSRGEI